MASEVEEPFSLNFQFDSFRSGSISFGRYENEALCWERWSSFSQNRYLEEVEKCSKPGSVTEKKAYFEAHFKKKLAQNSPECQNEIESETSEIDISEKRDYNEETTMTFDGSVNETEESGKSFSEPQIELTSDNTKNTKNHEIEEKIEACLKEKLDLSPKEKIPSEDKYTKPQVSDGQSRRNTSRNSSKISENKANKTIPSKSRAEIKTSNAPIKYERGSKIKGAEKGSINRTLVETKSSTPQKISSRVHQSANRAKQDVGANKPVLRQDNSRFGLKSDERAQRRKELEEKTHAKKAELPQLRTKTQEKTKIETKQLSKSLNSKAIPMPSFHRGALREPAGSKDISTKTKPQKPSSKSSSTPGSRVSKNTTSSERAKTSDQAQGSRATSSYSTLTSDSSASSPAVTSNAHKRPSVVSCKKDVQKEKLKPNQNTIIGRILISTRPSTRVQERGTWPLASPLEILKC